MSNKIDFKGSVVLNPVPVVLITSKGKDGKDNVFTVGWIGTVCTKPPMLSISIRPERLSYEYIKETMEFIVNIPTSKMTEAVDYCGVRSGRKVDKISEMKFRMKEGSQVNVPYIDDCPISIECKVKTIMPLGTHDIFIAEVVCSHINENLIDEKGKIHFEEADLITYCHGSYYKMNKNELGSFGYSVSKKVSKKPINEKTNKKNKKSNKKSYSSTSGNIRFASKKKQKNN